MAEIVSGKVAHDSADDSHIFPVKVGGVYRATPPAVSDGDVVDLLVDESGKLQVDIAAASISGDVAHDAVDSGNPVKVGGHAYTSGSLPTAVASDDRANMLVDLYGRPRIVPEFAAGAAHPGDNTGGQYVQIRHAAGALSNALGVKVNGVDAVDDALTANPVYAGGRAHTQATLPTAVSTNGDAVPVCLDLYGRVRNVLEYADASRATGDTTYGLDVDVTRLPAKTTVSGSASSATDIIASTDATRAVSASIQLTGTWSGTVRLQSSNDGTNWVNVACMTVDPGSTTSPATSSNMTATGVYTAAVSAAFVKLVCSSYSSGTIVATMTLSPVEAGLNFVRGTVACVGPAAQGATASGNPVRIGGVYQSSPSTLSDGQIGTPLLNSSGQLNVVMSSGSVGGQAAHDAAISGNPLRIAGRARGSNSPYLGVAQDDVADLATTTEGLLRVAGDASSLTTGTDVKMVAAETGGSTPVAVKSGAGNVYRCYGYSPNAAVSYLQLFNTAVGSVTVGTTTPARVIPLPAASSFSLGGDVPMLFGSNISYALTTTPTGSTAPVSACLINIEYK